MLAYLHPYLKDDQNLTECISQAETHSYNISILHLTKNYSGFVGFQKSTLIILIFFRHNILIVLLWTLSMILLKTFLTYSAWNLFFIKCDSGKHFESCLSFVIPGIQRYYVQWFIYENRYRFSGEKVYQSLYIIYGL